MSLIPPSEIERAMSDLQRAQERVRKRRDELGDEEIERRQRIRKLAQEICHQLVLDPNRAEVNSMLEQAEALRAQLDCWIWGVETVDWPEEL